jgi:hypothetical protein
MGQMECRAAADRSDGRDAELRRPAPRGAAGYDIQVADALAEAMGQQRGTAEDDEVVAFQFEINQVAPIRVASVKRAYELNPVTTRAAGLG